MTKKIGLGLLFAVAALLSLRIVVPWVNSSFFRKVDKADVTYLCTETKEVVRGPAQPEPAVNPKTGRRTLVRAMYANATQQWVQAPSEQAMRQNRKYFSATDGKSPMTFAPPAEAPRTQR